MQKFIAFALLIASAQSVSAQVSLEDATRPTVRLEGSGQPSSVLVNCPWDRTLIIRPATKAPAAVLQCSEDGPGTIIELKH